MLPTNREVAERLLAEKLGALSNPDTIAADTLPPPSGWSRPPSLVFGGAPELSFLNMATMNSEGQSDGGPAKEPSFSPFGTATNTTASETGTDTESQPQSPFYSLSATTIRGAEFPFSQLRNKVVIIVNVASKCGFTPQYKNLQALYEKYKDRGLVIIGFPCDQFANQEPNDDAEIESFCQINYGVTFPLMSKCHVNGNQAHPVYEYLKKQQKQALMEMIKWNFEKFLIDREGNVVQRFSSMADPFKHLEPAVEKLLAA